MKCAWKDFLSVLPPELQGTVDAKGRDNLQELRLRVGRRAQLVKGSTLETIDHRVTSQDIRFVVNTASRYSPWAATGMASGFLTAPGGHRIGLCGDAVIQDGHMTGLRDVSSLNLRVARDFPGIAEKAGGLSGNLLLLGAPGTGKTTLLRDLIRQVSNSGSCVTVVDERMELFPRFGEDFAFDTGENTDVLQGCGKSQGLDMALRTMNPSYIAVDEITRAEDCAALLTAGWCGVHLLATVHASSSADLKNRKVYRPLVETGLFHWLIILHRDKSWHLERMVP